VRLNFVSTPETTATRGGTPRGQRAPIAFGLGLLVAGLLALDPGNPGPGLLYLAPALVLLAALVLDRYPGERTLAAVANGWRPVRRRDRRRPARLPLPPRSLPRGGVLLSLALASRGPPR
jgi:hypothetical protein